MALTKVPSNLDSITATTQSQGDGSTNVATTAYVDTGLSALIDSAPGNLNTLNELAAAMNDNASFFSTVLPLSGGTMTGNIAHASDLTLDLGGDLIVDVDGDNVWFDAAGTRFLSISQVSSDVYIGAEQNDKDLIFRGKDGSSTITALTLDMSEAGKATFNNAIVASGISQFADVNIPDNNAIRFGSSQDLQIYHDGTNSHITNNTGYTTLRTSTASGYLYLHGDNVQFRGQSANEPMITAVCNGPVQLYYDNSLKLLTSSTGINLPLDGESIKFGANSEIVLTHEHNVGLNLSGSDFKVKTTSSTANDRAGAGFTATESATDGDRRAVMYLDADNGAYATGDSGAYFYIEKKGGGGEVSFINQDATALNFQIGGAHKKLTISGNNLHLNGGTDARIQLGTSGAGATSTSNDTVHIRGDGDNMKLMTAANGAYIFEENGNQHMRINSGGDIAIGNHTPSHDVHIKRDASETALAIQSNVGGSGSSYGGRLRLQLGAQSNSGSGNADTQAGDVLGQIMFEGQGTDYSYQGGNIKTIVTTGDGDDGRSNQATAMTFETIGVGSVSPAERMRIDSTGRVGINRTPTKSNSKLEVGGADNVGLIHVEASGNFASWGIGSNQSKFYYNDTQMMGLTNIGELKLMGGSTTGRQDIVFSNGNMSIANEATYTLSGVLNTGALVSIGVNRSNVGVTYDHCLIFAETGTAATVVANPSGRIAINSATTANKVNIFVNGSHLVIQNKVASTVTVSVAAFVFQGN